MSAYIVNQAHVIALAAFAATRDGSSWNVDPAYLRTIEHGRSEVMRNARDCELATMYATILMAENIRSVNHRYNENTPAEIVQVGPRDMIRHVDPLWILKMCDGLEYQSCETEDWPRTIAYELLNHIRSAAIRRLPGYDQAPWEFTEAKAVTS